MPEEKIQERVKNLADKASLDEKYLDFYPSELSGGGNNSVSELSEL